MNIIRMSGGLGNQMFHYALYLKLRSMGKEVKFVGMDGMPSDHYLWLTGEAAKMLRREKPLSFEMPRRDTK